MTNSQYAILFSSALLLTCAADVSAQGQPTTAQPPTTTASEIAGIQAAINDCPRVFLTTTWTLYDKTTAQTTLSYAFVECGSSTGLFGGGVIPNADFAITRTGARLLTTTENGVVDITWNLDGESQYSTDGTTLYVARKVNTVKTVHHSDSLSAVVSGTIGGRKFGARSGYIATVRYTSSDHPSR